MIVRILGEDQYDVPDDLLASLNELDNACVVAVEAGDEEGFHATYDELLALVRERGELLGEDHLGGSDLMLPPSDITMDEARDEFTGDGLIPD
jgi:PspAA-like protein